MSKFLVLLAKGFFVVALLFIGIVAFNTLNPKDLPLTQLEPTNPNVSTNDLASQSDVTVGGNLLVKGDIQLVGALAFQSSALNGDTKGKVISVDENGQVVLVADQVATNTTKTVYETKNTTTTVTNELNLPDTDTGHSLYFDGTDWKTDDNLYNAGGNIGIYTTSPVAALDVHNQDSSRITSLFQGSSGQTVNMSEWQLSSGTVVASLGASGKLSLLNSEDEHSLYLQPTGNAGYLSSSGGSIFLDNTYNIGSGFGIYSNAGADALGNMINIKVDNSQYAQAAFYMDYDGTSNAVEIVSNSTDTSSNALSVTGNNTNDSTVGIIGYETGRGTVKISHNGTGTDSNASAISIDLKGTGTRSQGVYVDSTATGGTLGNLLRLRNETIDRFVVSATGSLSMGSAGTNSSFTKTGNTTGDEFFIGTNGAFRVQRSATDSEAFRTQVVGDSQGRWLGTSDGKLKFGSGSATQDVIIQRTGVGLFDMDTDVVINSQATSNDALLVKASDGANLAKISENASGDGLIEIDNTSGTAIVTLKSDGTTSSISSGSFALGGTSVGTSGVNVLALYNGTAPSSSITDGVQLYAEDVVTSELRVRDEAGNITTLSPHNFSLIPSGPSEDMAWSYYSERDDLAINVDMLKALRLIESFSGEQLVYVKNVLTGEEVFAAGIETVAEHETVNILNSETKLYVDESFSKSLKTETFEKHVGLTDKIWTFISSVIFKAEALFEGGARFLAGARFEGTIEVSANTSGTVIVPSGTRRYQVSFKNAYQTIPVVYLSSYDDSLKQTISEITKNGFTVTIDSPVGKHVTVSWLALLADQNTDSFKVLESSSESTTPIEVVQPLATSTPVPSSIEETEIEASQSATALPI